MISASKRGSAQVVCLPPVAVLHQRQSVLAAPLAIHGEDTADHELAEFRAASLSHWCHGANPNRLLAIANEVIE